MAKSKSNSNRARYVPLHDFEQSILGVATPDQTQPEVLDVLRTPPPNMKNVRSQHRYDMAPYVPARTNTVISTWNESPVPDVLLEPPNTARRHYSDERRTDRFGNTTWTGSRTSDVLRQGPYRGPILNKIQGPVNVGELKSESSSRMDPQTPDRRSKIPNVLRRHPNMAREHKAPKNALHTGAVGQFKLAREIKSNRYDPKPKSSVSEDGQQIPDVSGMQI